MHKHDTSQQFAKQPVNNHNESTMYNTKHLFPTLMQSSYALQPATSYPIGGMCYAIIEAHIDRVKSIES